MKSCFDSKSVSLYLVESNVGYYSGVVENRNAICCFARNMMTINCRRYQRMSLKWFGVMIGDVTDVGKTLADNKRAVGHMLARLR